MLVYRIVNKKFAGDLSGIGAALFGGRWNKKGAPVLYTGESKEIALLETIVNTPSNMVPELEILHIEIPDYSIKIIQLDELPLNWAEYPAPTILSEIAEKWILSEEALAFRVPSCIIHSANNYILNCRHPHYNLVKIQKKEPFLQSKRLFKNYF